MRFALPSGRPSDENAPGNGDGPCLAGRSRDQLPRHARRKERPMTSTIVSHQTVRLRRGKHASPEEGVCVMELASMLAGEPFSDRPQAVCPVIGAYLRSYNDVVDDERRQDLYRYASEAIGSAGAAALRRRRAGRCPAEIARLHDQRSRVRRWLSGRPELSLPGSSIELERVGMHLARALQRSGPEGHARALALADELIAMAPGPARPAARRAQTDRPAARV